MLLPKKYKTGGDTDLIYDKISKLAKEKNMSIREIERMAGLGNGVIAGWKNSSPQVDSLQRVAMVLKVNINELLE